MSTTFNARNKLDGNWSTNTPGRPAGSNFHLDHPSLRQPSPIPAPHDHPSSVFAPTVALRPEHYRAVTPFSGLDSAAASGSGGASNDYRYPIIPLTFAERKRLSDTLFYLSKELPTATADCAKLLREAREAGEWDLAVAELLTQVLVGLYCGEGDTCLDGLQHYLLGLGISC
jgi:hypothetical protein